MKKLLFILILLNISKNVFAQSSNVNLVSKWMHDANFTAVYGDGNYVYCASGRNFYILDISNPAAIKGMSAKSLDWDIDWIVVTNSTAYIAQSDSGLCIVDVSNPNIPVIKGKCKTSGKALSVKISGNYAFVAADTAGVRIIDISNVNAPVEVGHYDIGGGHAKVVDVSGNYAFIAYGIDGMHILDISNIQSPVVVSTMTLSVNNVFISGNHAYTLADTINTNQFCILNISNPMSPVIDAVTVNFNSNGNCLFVSGNLAYTITTMGEYQIWDISIPSSPAFVAYYNLNMSSFSVAQQIFVNGTKGCFIYYPDGAGEFHAIDIIDFANPVSPLLLGKYLKAEYFAGICKSGNYLYVGGFAAPTGELIYIFDITDPYHPQLASTYFDTSSYSIGFANNFTKSGNYLYLSTTRTAPGIHWGVKIIDVSNPSNPFKAGSFTLNGIWTIDIAVLNNYAYICNDAQGLAVVDVSNPGMPLQVGSLILSGGFPPASIDITGNKALITDNAGKLHIIDISIPASPIELGNVQLGAVATDVAADGNFAYVSIGTSGFQIIDFSVPNLPVITGTYPSISSNNSISKSGNYVYVSDELNGLQVVDVSNPANPVQVGYYYDVTSSSRRVFADSQHSYLSTLFGVYIFDGPTFNSTGPQITMENEMKTAPNPFHSAFSFTLPDYFSGSVSWTIKNTQGQILISRKESVSQFPYTKMIETGELPPGVYFLEVTHNNGRLVRKIVRD